MNKSKFLKKSLAALLAILMVVAMIPLSAAAEEAPAPEGPKAPTITVNNATATAPTEEGGAYTATVRDATTVSVSWINAEEGYSAWILTERGVSVAVPFRALDLLTEGKELEKDSDGNVTYQVTFELKKAGATAQDEAVASYPLNIKVLASVPNDDTTIKLVRPNQEFRLNSVQHKFIGISAEPVDNENNVITITLPLGMTFGDAGFSDGAFGGVATKDNSIPGSLINGDGVDRINRNNAVARKVFVPNSVYSTVRYQSPIAADGDATLTVTSRDGHSRNYTVRFVPEEALENVKIDGAEGTKRVDKDGNVTYTVYTSSLTNDGAQTFTVDFEKGSNVVRVEDPINNTKTAYPEAWSQGATIDAPVRKGQNKIHFFGNANEKVAYLTVKTQANMAPNTENMGVDGPAFDMDGAVDMSFFRNVKLVLRKSTATPVGGAVLTELQLNGYEAIWRQGRPLDEILEEDADGEIKIYVDYDFEFSTGDGQHPARISGTVKGTHVSIPAQDSSQVLDDYWRMGKVPTDDGRVTKPNDPKFALDKVNTEDGRFVLRVWNNEAYKDYPIRIIKTSSNKGVAVSGVHLYQPDATMPGGYRIWDATSSTGKNWQFKLPDNLYRNSAGSAGVESSLTSPNFPEPTAALLGGDQPTTTVANFPAAGFTFTVRWNDNLDVQYQDAIREVLDQKIAAGALGEDLFVDENATVRDNADLFLVRGTGDNQVSIAARVKTVNERGVPGPAVDVIIASGVFTTSSDTADLLPEVKNQIVFYTPNNTELATGTLAGTVTGTLGTLAEPTLAFAGDAGTIVTNTGTGAQDNSVKAVFDVSGTGVKANLKNAAVAAFDAKMANAGITAAMLTSATVQGKIGFSLVQDPQYTLKVIANFSYTGTPNPDGSTAALFEKLEGIENSPVVVATGTIENAASGTAKTADVALTIPGAAAGSNDAGKITITIGTNNTANTTTLKDLVPETWLQTAVEVAATASYTVGTPDVEQPATGRADWLGVLEGMAGLNNSTRTAPGTNVPLGTVSTNYNIYASFDTTANAAQNLADQLEDIAKNNTTGFNTTALSKVAAARLSAKLIGNDRAPKFELYANVVGPASKNCTVKLGEATAPVVFKNGKASITFPGYGVLTFTAIDKSGRAKYIANNDVNNVFYTLINATPGMAITNANNGSVTVAGWSIGVTNESATGNMIANTATNGSYITENLTISFIIAGDGTITPVLPVASAKELVNQVRYTGSGSSEAILNSTLRNCLLVIDTPQGAVITPGGVNKNGKAITEQAGVSLWNNGNGFNEGWPTGNVYTELEKGVTTLGDWWLNKENPYNGGTSANYIYTRNKDNDGAGAGINTDRLYFTVKNGYDGPESVYTITLAGTTNNETPNTKDELIFTNAFATSGIDEDLVYGGNTVTNAIQVVDTAVCALPDIVDHVVRNQFTSTSEPPTEGWVNPANAAYINAIGGNNLYSDIKVETVPNEKNASVVTITVPADFADEYTNTPKSLFFGGLLAADGSTTYRLISEGTVTAETDDKLPKFNLDMKNQYQQTSPTTITDGFSEDKEFVFDGASIFSPGSGGRRQDISAWSSNDHFDSSKVSPDNILYVVSAETKNSPNFPQIVNARNINDIGAHKYYITVRREGKKTGDELKKMKAEENTPINVTSNNSLKTLELHVPATYDWAGYRDNASKDFQLNFELSDGALLIDAYRDPAFGFKYNKNVSPSLYADFSLTDLTKEMQEVARWTSAGEDAVNPTTFFVKNGELYMINPNTGIETQITGMGDEVNDYFIDSRWSQIMAKEAELRVYNEARNQVNTYKLKLVIDPVTSVAEITHLTVDESTAVVNNETRKATVKLPSDTDLEAVKLSIAVSPQARIISIAGEDYDPTDKEATYNITEGINIVIEAGDGTTYTYNLVVDGTDVEPANAEITKLTVDSIEAEVNNTARTATVELPEGSDLSKVKLAIEVSEGDKLVSVAGEEFDAEAEYDLSSPIAIVIEAEDGTKYDYTLTGTVAKPVEPVNPADKYTDLDKIQKEETRDEVKKAINLGLMNGISESKGIFGVGMKMQRFQFALVVARADLREQLLAEDENADVTVNALDAKLVELYPDNYTFTDVSEKIELKAAAAAVQYCYDKGYINGKSLANKIFDPTGNITREEAAKIMVLWAGLEHDDTDVSAIPDGDQISNWAKGYVKAAADAGIMKGRTDGNFDPKGDLQRQDGACLLVRTYENYIVKADEDETPDDGDDDNDNNDGDDDTNNPGGDEDDTSKPDDDTSNPDQDGDDDSSSTPDGEDDNSSSTPDEDNESQPTE